MISALTPARLRQALAMHRRVDLPALPGRRNHLPAAVLVPLLWRGGPIAVATVRARGLRLHAGEVCFPGGRPEEGDADMFATACREAREEVGIEGARLLGRLSSFPLYTSDYRLDPFVAEVPDAPPDANPSEVSEVLTIPLADVFAQSTIDGIPWEHEGEVLLSPAFTFGPHVMYGGTAHVLYELLEVASRAAGVSLPALKPGRYRWSDLLP